jgi:hypothetical protein
MKGSAAETLVEARGRGLLEELNGLFGPAFGPALKTYGRPFAEQLGRDERFRAEVRDRFERGSALGGFPNLSALLSGMTPTQQDEFFETGWTRHLPLPPGQTTDPWNRLPWVGDKGAYREDLHAGMAFAFSDLPTFAREWLEELSRVGYYGMEASSGMPLKQRSDEPPAIPRTSPSGEAYPVRFGGTGQTIWLNLDGPRSIDGGYRRISVSEEPLRTDGAIFAALTALEGRPLDVGQLREALPDIMPLQGESVREAWTKALGKRRTRKKLKKLLGDLRHHQVLDYLLMLLRHHRPDFDDAPLGERAELLAGTCAHVNEFLEVLRRLMAYVEYGLPGRATVSAARSAARDVEAAVLKDVEGLTNHEIGERLGLSPPVNFPYKGDHPTARKIVARGRKILTLGLGEKGWQARAEAMRTDARRFLSLDEAHREAQSLAEALGISQEEALRGLDEEKTVESTSPT